jgi:hypothetical protein
MTNSWRVPVHAAGTWQSDFRYLVGIPVGSTRTGAGYAIRTIVLFWFIERLMVFADA